MRRLLLFDRWDKKGFSRSSDRGSNLLPLLEKEGPPFRSTFPFSRLIPSSRSAVDSNVGTSSSLSSSIFDTGTNEYIRRRDEEEKKSKETIDPVFFSLSLSLSSSSLPVKNRRTVENVSQPIFPANYWRGEGGNETRAEQWETTRACRVSRG